MALLALSLGAGTAHAVEVPAVQSKPATRLAVIDLSAFSAGPYFIEIMADGKFYYTCVIKR